MTAQTVGVRMMAMLGVARRSCMGRRMLTTTAPSIPVVGAVASMSHIFSAEVRQTGVGEHAYVPCG